ncbi:low molecular weight protein-tyrosine-phosphatase [Bacillus weihaiensis]|uniref:low molecular weight protein-tyrosine-phosphatase n=1 Tax=Bacillus weihaiensis TaxID=1547283 RepID=UPI002352846F|nr:low molecular weight protein-tyrosine-phosphatase [Bacillus weihaiensis]
MIRILFVCLGNICRSPMAEAVMRHLINQEGLQDDIVVDSAGTGHWHIGKPPHEGTRSILDQYQISYEGQKARQLEPSDLSAFDYIIGMDHENVGNSKKLAGDLPTGTIRQLLDYIEDSPVKDVPDPYYTGQFDKVYDMVLKACENMLKEIKHRHNLKGKGE